MTKQSLLQIFQSLPAVGRRNLKSAICNLLWAIRHFR
jgi:hypothetical protein